MADCIIGLGSNVDDRSGNIRNALNSMTLFCRLSQLSSVYETEPVGYPHQGWFINIVARGIFDGDPLELLRLIMKIQDSADNDKKHKNAPRKVDIDIIAFNDVVINTQELTLPHPGMTNRLFVLLPMKEIYPDFIHPVSGDTIDKLIENCTDKSIVKPRGRL